MKRFIVPLFAALATAGLAFAADVKSGVAIGEKTTAFNVKDVTGPSKGTSLCYRCQYGNRPVACVFTREITPEVAALVKEIDQSVAKNAEKKMAGFVVLLTDDADAGAKQLAKLAEEQKITKVPLTVFDGAAGPEKYKIAKDAAVTVMMWNNGRVEVNEGYAAGKLSADEAKKAAAQTDKILK